MARKLKLTWQPGSNGREGRWKKKYKAKVYYFAGGRGKSDRTTYNSALSEWEKLKVLIDTNAPKRHQADYERAIEEWESVLDWSRKHNEGVMAEKAITKLKALRKALSDTKPIAVKVEDKFESQFELSIRNPSWNKVQEEIGNTILKLSKEKSSYQESPGYDEYIAACKKFRQGITGKLNTSTKQVIIDPSEYEFDIPNPLKIEQRIWRDRLEVDRTVAIPKDKTIRAFVETFIQNKQNESTASKNSVGRIRIYQNDLMQFLDWLGHGMPVEAINAKTLMDYRSVLLNKVNANELAPATAKGKIGSVKTFVRWLWQIEAIPNLPRIMDAKSSYLSISVPHTPVIIFTKEEISTLLKEASTRTKLYMYLMLNCGMTQKDIADLDHSEIDLDAGCIIRKRSKTRKQMNVPCVNYKLWGQTLDLLKLEQCSSQTGRVLLNKSGGSLWTEEAASSGGYIKKDNIKSAFDRLRKKVSINKPLKSLKKTSASLLRNKSKYATLDSLFLGHAPQTIAQKHYTQAPQELFDEAILWLATEYGVE